MPRETQIAGRSITIAIWLVVMTTLGPSSASAQQPVNNVPALATAVHRGDSVAVRDQTGKTVRGTIAGITSSTLRVRTDGVVREWSASDISEVRRRGDSLRNGIRWGAIAGAGGAAIIGGTIFALCASEGGSNCDRQKPLSILIPLAAGIGGGIAIDAAHRGETVVYRRSSMTFAPAAVAPRSYGVAAAWRF